jgi:hypothetical protein
VRELLHGTMLGDGYLEPHGKGVRLQVVHSVNQREYIEWKHKELASLHPGPLYYYAKAKYPFWRFVTKSHPYLIMLRELFYPSGKKIVPDCIMELIREPQSLAVWFMDDGTVDKRRGSVLFETQSFSIEDIEKLQYCLQVNFDIQSKPIKSGNGRGLRLYVSIAESRKLKTIIEPYVISQMRYKLPSVPVTTEAVRPR